MVAIPMGGLWHCFSHTAIGWVLPCVWLPDIGEMLNCSSMACFLPGYAIYSATKFGHRGAGKHGDCTFGPKMALTFSRFLEGVPCGHTCFCEHLGNKLVNRHTHTHTNVHTHTQRHTSGLSSFSPLKYKLFGVPYVNSCPENRPSHSALPIPPARRVGGFLAGAYHELKQHGVDLSVYYPGSCLAAFRRGPHLWHVNKHKIGCIYIYIHIYTHIYIYTYTYIYVCIYIHIHISKYVNICIHVFTYIYIYIHLHIYIYTYIHIHTLYIYIYVCIYTHMYIYI